MSSTQEEHSIYKTSEKLSQKLNNNLHNSINDQEIADLANEIKQAVYENVKTRLPNKIYQSVEEETMFGFSPSNRVEKFFETLLFWSRWLMLPVYLFGALVMLALAFEVISDILHLVPMSWDVMWGLHNGNPIALAKHRESFIIEILTVLDHLLIGSLIVMVLISGYENTVSRIKAGEGGPSWLGKIGISDLKTKIASSIVAISSVHLLQIFLGLEQHNEVQEKFNFNVMWAVIVHLVFIVSALILAYVAKMHPEDAHSNMEDKHTNLPDVSSARV